MDLLGKKYTKQEILERIGDISQIGGIKKYEFSDGVSKGIRALDFKNGNGLDITVLIDRGLSISDASYRGISFVWKSGNKETHPLYYDQEGYEWLKTFIGGLLETCGLTYFGEPCKDNGQTLGLHGRISNIQAYNVSTDGVWEGDDYHIWVKGRVREASVFGDKLELERKISMKLGEDAINIEDSIENIGFKDSPLMTLYHMNFGFPLIDNGTKLELFDHKTILYLENATKFKNDYKAFIDPVDSFKQQVYVHDIASDSGGNCNIVIINNKFAGSKGFGIHLKFNKDNLGLLTEWKMMGKGEYVVGIEPGNAPVRGRAVERKEGYLKFIKPGQVVKNEIEVSILKSNDEIIKCCDLIKKNLISVQSNKDK